jgi:Ca2+-binding EF-hand superfamily protein
MVEQGIKAEIKDIFMTFDTDGSGDISEQEVRVACACLGLLVSDAQH